MTKPSNIGKMEFPGFCLFRVGAITCRRHHPSKIYLIRAYAFGGIMMFAVPIAPHSKLQCKGKRPREQEEVLNQGLDAIDADGGLSK
jgi:hypothetical protein